MKKTLILMLAVFSLVACSTKKELYCWEDYNKTSYKYVKNGDEKSLEELMETYETIIKKKRGSRKVVPPGVYADYGYILLQVGRTDEGKKMLEKEIELYPESKVFIDRVLKMLE